MTQGCGRSPPNVRPSIAAIKGLIQRHRAEAVTLQKLSVLNETVIPAGQVDDPLAHEPPKLIGAEYDPNGMLRLTLDRPAHDKWVRALQNLGSYSSIIGDEPERFRFQGNTATVSIGSHSAQAVIDYFKQWLLTATRVLKQTLEQEIRSIETRDREELRRARKAEEKRLEINRSLRF